MKKVMSILAVMVISFGMFSCEKSTDQALYEKQGIDPNGGGGLTKTDGRT